MEATPASIPSRTIGIDLGDTSSCFCVLDQEGRVLEEGVVEMREAVLKERFANSAPARVVIEASGPSHWVQRCLSACGLDVVVANPRHLRMISQNERKCDRNDARLLARVGRVDPELLHPVALRSEKCFAARVLLGARAQLVATRTRLIGLIRFECKVVGGRIEKCEPTCFHERARTQLPECLRSALEPLLGVLAELHVRIRSYDKQIASLCKTQFPVTRLLRQVAGVGPVVALTYAATIDDPRRFKDSRSVGAYLGLVPRSRQSGGSSPQLRITKAGDTHLRHLLVSAAAYILRRSSPDSDLKRYGARIGRTGSARDRARARVAVARKLANLLHRLWVTGEVYEPLYATKRAA